MKEPIKLEHEMNPMLPKENLGEQGDNVEKNISGND